MVAVKLSNFGGMVPAVDDRLLAPNAASEAINSWLYAGTVKGFQAPVPIHTLASTGAKKAFRIPIEFYDKDHIPDSYWLEFENPDTDVIQSPVVSDAFDRFYWASDTLTPQYNTKARIAVGDVPFTLGIPGPTVAPGATVVGGVSPVETRAYVYTRVSAYGEEGPPSPALVLSGNASGSWNLTFTAVGPAAIGRNISFTRIYRTITGLTGATAFYFVTDIAVATLTYNDTIPTTTVSGGNILKSTFYQPPPANMAGIISMPNGIVAGFRNNEIVFSEPYLPHAWPPTYAVSVEGQVVGLGVIGQTLIVCTTGAPYAISGVNPANMAISRMASTEPCLSRGSIVSTPIGVAYASPNGVALAVPGQVEVITRKLINKDKWLDQAEFLNVPTLRAAALNGGYYCWGSAFGATFDPGAFLPTAFTQEDFAGAFQGAFVDLTDSRVAYTKLENFTATFNCYADVWTGETLIIRQGQVLWLDLGPDRNHDPYLWRSKTLETPDAKNFGAMRIRFKTLNDTPLLSTAPTVAPVQALAPGQWGLARVYADDVLKFTREIRSTGEIFRLPSGFKATYWQVEIEARVELLSVELATTAKELGSV